MIKRFHIFENNAHKLITKGNDSKVVYYDDEIEWVDDDGNIHTKANVEKEIIEPIKKVKDYTSEDLANALTKLTKREVIKGFELYFKK